MKKTIFIAFCSLLCGLPVLAQTSSAEPDDIGVASDEFQNYFYESLKQKGIENYDKAITALEKCESLQPNNPAVYNELGKDYLFLKDYKKAYDAFQKASQLDPKNKWYLAGMYDVCYQTQDWNQAIVIVTQLVKFDAGYKEDLVSLYMNTQQFDKALALINELNDTVGKSEKRELYKADILASSKYQEPEKDRLVEQIKKNPKDEEAYLSLIYLYSNNNQEEKALEVAKKLEKEIPESDWAQVSLFKFHLNNNDGDKAVVAMNKVLKSNKIDNKIKHRVINEFLIFTQTNPKYSADLEKATQYFSGDKEAKTAKEIGKFYQTKKDWAKAVEYYELDNKANPNDVETALLLFNAYLETQQYDVLSKKADAMTELYPLQPEFYYYSGTAYNQLKNFRKAKDILLTGIDYLVDNKQLEANFNIQLGEAYSGLGDVAKKESYFQKADKLLKQKK